MIVFQLFLSCVLRLVLFTLLYFYPFGSHFRFSRRKAVFISSALILAASLLFPLAGAALASISEKNWCLSQLENILFLFCLVPCLLGDLTIVEALWQKKIFVCLYTVTGALSTICMSNCIDISARFTSPAVTAAAVPLFWLLLKYCYLPAEDGLSAKESGYLAVLSVSLFAILAGVFSYVSFKDLFRHPLTPLLFLLLLTTLFVIYLILFKIYYTAHEEYKQVQHQMDLYGKHYAQMQEQIENNRRLRHDLNHHMRALQGYLYQGEPDKAEEYLVHFLKNTRSCEVSKICDNPIVNMLVSHYYSLAKKNHIAFAVRIDIPKQLFIHNSDLSVLLGNLLENAMEAASHAPDNCRSICFHMSCSGNMLVIAVDNGFNGTAKLQNHQYLSTKPNHNGLGLKTLENIAKKYGGGASFTHEGTIFHSSVMLTLMEQEAYSSHNTNLNEERRMR